MRVEGGQEDKVLKRAEQSVVSHAKMFKYGDISAFYDSTDPHPPVFANHSVRGTEGSTQPYSSQAFLLECTRYFSLSQTISATLRVHDNNGYDDGNSRRRLTAALNDGH